MSGNNLIVRIDPAGSPPRLEIQFGDANIGAYRVFRVDAGGPSRLLAQGSSLDTSAGSVPLGQPASQLLGATLSYEAVIQSAGMGPGEPYSLSVSILQNGAPGGVHREAGKLNDDGAKSVSGFIFFKTL